MLAFLSGSSEWVVAGLVAAAVMTVGFKLYRSLAGKGGCAGCQDRRQCAKAPPPDLPQTPADEKAAPEA